MSANAISRNIALLRKISYVSNYIQEKIVTKGANMRDEINSISYATIIFIGFSFLIETA